MSLYDARKSPMANNNYHHPHNNNNKNYSDNKNNTIEGFVRQATKCIETRNRHGGDDDALPFFPKYESQRLYQNKLLVTWFETDFSQSRYNLEKYNNGSNACTLIAILMAAFCTSQSINAHCPHGKISFGMVKSLGTAMLDGNSIYNRFKRRGELPNVNLSIPEAISLAGKTVNGIREWKSILFCHTLESSLSDNVQNCLNEWNMTQHGKRHNYFFIVLICNSRSVLFIINKTEKTVALVDSHQHSASKGAAIATVRIDDIYYLCQWLAHNYIVYHKPDPSLYELSFLYFRRKTY